MTEDITIDVLKKIVPKIRRSSINQKFVDELNGLMSDDSMRDSFRDNILGYAEILKEGRYSLVQYVNAVRFVTYKVADNTNIDAYVKSNPTRYQNMINNDYSDKDIHSVISSYHKSKLVTSILDKVMIPSHIINQDLHQKAINHLAYLMLNARSEKVQSDSASKLVDALKIPESAKIEVDVLVKQDSAIDDLRVSTLELVRQQKMMIQAGIQNAKEIGHSKIIDSTSEIIE